MGRCAVLVAFASALFGADELRTPGEEVLVELDAALLAGDSGRAARLLGEAGEIFRFPASEEEAQRLLLAAAEATKARDHAVAAAAFRALGATGSELAVPHLEPHLRSLACTADEEPSRVEAVRAAGRLLAPALVAPLANLARKCESATVAEQAFFSLGAFARAPTELRKQVVGRVLEAAAALERASGREEARARRLRPAALRALQRLVGIPLSSVRQYEQCWSVVKDREDPFPRG